jgi:hypothetical protein
LVAIVDGGLVRCCRGEDCEWAEEVDGVVVGGLIAPGSKWDLDHTDDRSGYLGAAHSRCNRRAGALKRNRRTRRSRVW